MGRISWRKVGEGQSYVVWGRARSIRRGLGLLDVNSDTLDNGLFQRYIAIVEVHDTVRSPNA
jgi:hypothetical protein